MIFVVLVFYNLFFQISVKSWTKLFDTLYCRLSIVIVENIFYIDQKDCFSLIFLVNFSMHVCRRRDRGDWCLKFNFARCCDKLSFTAGWQDPELHLGLGDNLNRLTSVIPHRRQLGKHPAYDLLSLSCQVEQDDKQQIQSIGLDHFLLTTKNHK